MDNGIDDNCDGINAYSPQVPYLNGPAWRIPGRIEAEHFDEGVQGIAFFDLDDGNNGGFLRNDLYDHVDIEKNSESANIGWTSKGEWLEYTVNVTNSGTYDINTNLASGGSNSRFQLFIDGNTIGGEINIPNTGGIGINQISPVPVSNIYLSAGQHVFRFEITKGGGFNLFNFDFVSRNGSETAINTNKNPEGTDVVTSIFLSPNPAKNHLNINSNSKINEIVLYSLVGNLVKQQFFKPAFIDIFLTVT